MTYWRHVGLAADKLLNAIFGGDHTETISLRAARAERRGDRMGCVLCRLFHWFDHQHCPRVLDELWPNKDAQK